LRVFRLKISENPFNSRLTLEFPVEVYKGVEKGEELCGPGINPKHIYNGEQGYWQVKEKMEDSGLIFKNFSLRSVYAINQIDSGQDRMSHGTQKETGMNVLAVKSGTTHPEFPQVRIVFNGKKSGDTRIAKY